MPDERKTYPVSTIAKLLDLSERRIQQLSQKGVIPKSAHGEYDLVGAVQGYIRHLKENIYLQENGTTEEHIQRTRLLKLKADKAELQLQKELDEVVPADIAFDLIEEMNLAIRTRLLVMPSKLAPWLFQKTTGEIEKVLKDEIYEALDEISKTPFPEKVLQKLEQEESQDSTTAEFDS